MKRKSPNQSKEFCLFKAEIMSQLECLQARVKWLEEVMGL